MKKYLVPLMSMALVFSTAAVSMAAATVKGDFRYDMYEDESKSGAAKSWGQTDLRVNVAGDISESVSGSATFKLLKGLNGTQGTLTTFDTDEYFVNWKQNWGSVKIGYYEYEFTPSGVVLDAGGTYNVWPKVDTLITTSVNATENLTADVLFQPYAQNPSGELVGPDDGAYGLGLTYTADKWGVKASYANFKNDHDLTAVDVYYKLNDNMKVYANAVDCDLNTTVSDGWDPVVGFSWNNIANTKLFASVEYALEPRNKNAADEYNAYGVEVDYKFANNVGLEFQHKVVGDGENCDRLRLRFQF